MLGASGAKLLVDVKGRQFPGGSAEKRRYVWENWSTQDDIDGLTNWTELFGPEYLALFVFMYRIQPTVALQDDPEDVWQFREERYLLRAIPLADYRAHMRVRSPRWGTVGLPRAEFQRLVRPFHYYSHECPSARQEEMTHAPDQSRRLAEDTALALASFSAGGPASRRRGS